jgi:hypothetical protein
MYYSLQNIAISNIELGTNLLLSTAFKLCNKLVLQYRLDQQYHTLQCMKLTML